MVPGDEQGSNPQPSGDLHSHLSWSLVAHTTGLQGPPVTMLLPSMRLAADRTPEAGLAHEVSVPPFATVLAEGDTGVARGGPDEARPAEDVDGLVVQGLRAGPSLGVPDVEVDGHRCGGLRLGVDDPGMGCRDVVRLQGRCLERAVDVRENRRISPNAVFGYTIYREIAGGLRKTDPQVAGPVWNYLGVPPSHGI